MMNIDKKSLAITTVVCLLPLMLSIVLYKELPADIPFHWNMEGEPNDWMPKQFIWILPVGMALMNIFVQLIFSLDPKRERLAHVFKKVVMWIIPVITMILYPVTIFYALGMNIPIKLVILLMLGIMVLILGNYMPKLRRNYFAGIRVPWTMKNEENWNKTHRLAGWLWTVGGLIIIIAAFIMQSVPAVLFILSIAVMMIITVIPIIYSYVFYKKQTNTEEQI